MLFNKVLFLSALAVAFSTTADALGLQLFTQSGETRDLSSLQVGQCQGVGLDGTGGIVKVVVSPGFGVRFYKLENCVLSSVINPIPWTGTLVFQENPLQDIKSVKLFTAPPPPQGSPPPPPSQTWPNNQPPPPPPSQTWPNNQPHPTPPPPSQTWPNNEPPPPPTYSSMPPPPPQSYSSEVPPTYPTYPTEPVPEPYPSPEPAAYTSCAYTPDDGYKAAAAPTS